MSFDDAPQPLLNDSTTPSSASPSSSSKSVVLRLKKPINAPSSPYENRIANLPPALMPAEEATAPVPFDSDVVTPKPAYYLEPYDVNNEKDQDYDDQMMTPTTKSKDDEILKYLDELIRLNLNVSNDNISDNKNNNNNINSNSNISRKRARNNVISLPAPSPPPSSSSPSLTLTIPRSPSPSNIIDGRLKAYKQLEEIIRLFKLNDGNNLNSFNEDLFQLTTNATANEKNLLIAKHFVKLLNEKELNLTNDTNKNMQLLQGYLQSMLRRRTNKNKNKNEKNNVFNYGTKITELNENNNNNNQLALAKPFSSSLNLFSNNRFIMKDQDKKEDDNEDYEEDDDDDDDDDNDEFSSPASKKSASDLLFAKRLSDHRAGDGGARLITCSACGLKVRKPSLLKKHLISHGNFRPFLCSWCNISFKTKGNLVKHMKTQAHLKKCAEQGLNKDDEAVRMITSTNIDKQLLEKQMNINETNKESFGGVSGSDTAQEININNDESMKSFKDELNANDIGIVVDLDMFDNSNEFRTFVESIQEENNSTINNNTNSFLV